MRYGPRTLRAMAHAAGRRKVFIIGRNKTGTSTIARALEDHGAMVAHQATGERLLDDWARRDFTSTIRYCRTAQVFKDVPFSLPYTFQAVDAAFPGSKFILSVWSSPDRWYAAHTAFHARNFGGGALPTAEELPHAQYRYPGYLADYVRLVYDSPPDDPYHRDTLISHYERHVRTVTEYFRHRDDLLVLDIGADGARQDMCAFLDLPHDGSEFECMPVRSR